MTDQEFCNMMLQERLNVLLSRKKPTVSDEVLKKVESVLGCLNDADREVIERFQESLGDTAAENEEKAYLGGLQDGIKITAYLWKHYFCDK